MPATIEKQYRLRDNSGSFAATTGSNKDSYLVKFSEQVDQNTAYTLFIAASGNPIPRATLKQVGSDYLICESIDLAPVRNSRGVDRYWWEIGVNWRELESDEPQQRSNPVPNSPSGGTTDPADWKPTISRRSVVVWEPTDDAYYIAGYHGDAHTYFNAYADQRAPFLNSALQPFPGRNRQSRRYISEWQIKWIRATVPQALVDAEGAVNDGDFQLSHRGYVKLWTDRTARIDSVNISEVRWGAQQLWQIDCTIIEDVEGWRIREIDMGTAARAWDGDPDGNGGFLSQAVVLGRPALRQLVDAEGNPIQDPVCLDGDGQPCVETSQSTIDDEPAISVWEDFEHIDFDTLPLLTDLGGPPPP